MNNNLNYTKMKTKKMIFFLVFFCTLGINAQEPTCEGIDITSWKRVNTIPIDIKCVDIDYSKFYSVKPNIKIFTDIKKNSKCDCKAHKSIDFKKYNLITFYTIAGSCKQPYVNYILYNTGTKVPFLKITITQFGTCKNAVGVGFDCLVSKRLCPKEPKVCITRKIIEEKRL